MKKIFTFLLLISLIQLPVYSLTVDDSIDASIKKTYKTEIVEQQLLPSLPSIEPYDNSGTVFTPAQNTPSRTTAPSYNRQYKEISIKKGTKFKVRSRSAISDKTPRGTKISFVTVYPETSRYITIPAGTVIQGQITDSHPPQLFGNGGLIEIKADQILYKGSYYQIYSKISIANYKHIFLNNIKGKRKYISNMGTFIKPGARFMSKMWKVCGTLTNGPEILLTPLPLASGIVVYAVNAALSPILSIFSTGDSITIPKGSYFEIKLTQDAIIREY